MPLRRLLFVATFGLLPLLLAAPASSAPARGHVKASLVAADASVQPGKPVTVALRLQHDPHWHTYWENPGIGVPTTLKWTLPPGWQAGPIQWPAPIIIKDRQGNLTGNGYEGDILLPVTLTPPATLPPGDAIELKAAADWLECEAICVPGNAKLSLSLPVSADAPKPDAAWGEKIRATLARLPRSDPAWNVTATRANNAITLTLTPAAGAGANHSPAHTPTGLHFFERDALVAHDLPQTITPDGKGGFTLTAKLVPEADPKIKTITGIVTAQNGFRADGTLPGLAITAPLEKASPPFNLRDFAGTLVLAFFGGLILNLMPCVFPVLGLKILGFVNQSGSERSRIVTHGFVFTAGVLLSFWALAGALAIFRASGNELGWGFQLQEPGFVFTLAALLLVFAMNMSGVFEFGLGATAVGSGLQAKEGYKGSFFTGVLATVVATPCSAPILAPALGAALAVSTVESFVIFTAIGLGLSLPYLLLSIFPAAIKILPRPGAWMETFKQFMAFPLYATVGWLIWVLAGQLPDETLNAILGLIVIALGVWLYGRYHAPGASPGRARFGVIGMVALLAAGTAFGWPRASGVDWQPWSPEAVAALRQEGRIVYVDFTARWCATCQSNKKIVFGSGDVLKTFADKKVATLRADWTNRDPRITAELAAYGRSAVPFNVIWLPGKDAPVILPELLTPGTVLDALTDSNPPARATSR